MKTTYSFSIINNKILNFIILLLLLLFSSKLIAQRTSTGTSWSNPADWSPAGVPGNTDDVIINTNMTVDAATVSIKSLTINTSRTLTIGAANTDKFEVLGQVVVNGTFNDNNIAGTNRFSGGITNNTNIFISTSPVEFFGTSQVLDGSAAFNLNDQVTIIGLIQVTNNISHSNGLYIGGNLDGNGIAAMLLNNTLLRYNGANMPFMNAGNLNAGNVGNTFSYMRSGNQIVRPGNYYHISFAGSGVKDITSITVEGDFTRSGTATFTQTTGTLKFAGNTNTVYTNANIPTWNDFVVEKTGARLTLNNNITTTYLTVSQGTLDLGATAKTLTVNSDFAGTGTLDASAANHTIVLRGENNSIGSFVTGSSNTTVQYNLLAPGTQQTIFASPNYKNITLGTGQSGTTKSLGGPVTVAGAFSWSANFLVELGAFDLTLTPTATLAGVTFDLATNPRYFVTEGTGALVVQSNTAAGFINFNTGKPGSYPVGAGGLFNLMKLNSFSATVTGTGAIRVRAIANRQPNIPYYNNALQKYWKVETVNLSGISADVRFFTTPPDIIGNPSFYVPVVYDGTSLISPNNPTAPGVYNYPAGFGSNGSTYLTGDWTFYDPTVRTTLYSYQSGDWGDPMTWTTDPSGTTSVFPMVPGTGDAVVILNGRNVFTNVDRTIGSLNIQYGGTLDLKNTTANNLGPITGEGTLRLSTIELPTGNLTQFVSATGGTIEYYNLGTGTFVLRTTAPFTNTYNNLLVTNSTNQSFELRTDANITLNGNFSITRTGSGIPTFAIGNTGSNRLFTVNGTFNVGAGCTFRPSTAYNGTHTMTIRGNSTISGNAWFQNSLTYDDNTGGVISLTFSGQTSNTSFITNSGSSVRFWSVMMDKNEGAEIYINGPSGTTVFNRKPGINIQNTNGTMRLGSGISLVLGENDGGNHNIGQSNKFPVLWIDGANVTFGGSNSIVPYGTLKITSGNLDVITGSTNKTITLRENGLLQVDGGTVNMACLRLSMMSMTAHRGAYIQTGGTVNVTGETGPETYVASFSLPRPENVFKMSGGTLNISRDHAGGICPTGGLHIGSSDQNYEVTGGTVNIYSSNNYLFDISCTVPLYNLNVYKVGSGSNGKVRIRNFDWSFDGNNANKESAGAYALKVLNDFTIQSTGSPIFDAGDQDVIVNGNMTIANNATYVSGNNTLHFEKSANQTFTINGSTTFYGIQSNLINSPEDIIHGANFSLEYLTSTENVTELAPNGTQTAELLQETTDNGFHRFYTPFIPSVDPITASIFVKANGRNFVSLATGVYTNQAIAVFNLSTGTLVSTSGPVISTYITNAGNGWYRIGITSPGDTEYRMRLYLQSTASINSYAGNTSLGVYAWGAMAQISGSLSPYTPVNNEGLNSLAVTKSGSSTLTLTGSQSTVSLNGNLEVNSGLINIGTKTLNVGGNIINNTEIQSSGSGKVVMNGLFGQNIAGNGSGIFNHLVLSNTGGTNGSVAYTATSNFKVNTSLEMTTNRLLSIGNRRISFEPAATLVSTSGSFSNNRFIRTGGFLSDGGIEKEYNSSNKTFTYAFGTGNNYTPATITFTSNSGSFGKMNVRPVASKQLYVTDPDALDYYWKVNQTGFTGIAANSINAVFTYGDITVSPNITSYIPGYYNYADIAYTTINDVNAVNEASKTITFNPFSKLEGDYTAGVPAAFGAVIPYYSRTNGNWNTASTWSNNGHGGLPATGTPGAHNPVYIGDGAGYNHSVNVTTNNTYAGSLIVDYGSTLSIGTTTGHNFGALPYSTAGGAGTIRISSSTAQAEFPGGDFGLFFTDQGGTAEYYGTGNSFTLPVVTAAPNSLNIESYKNLRLASSGTDTLYIPDVSLTILNDLTIAGASGSVATMKDNSERILQINGNLLVNQGILQFPSAFSQTVNITGNINIAASGILRGNNTGSVTHLINLNGGLVNNGTLDFNTNSRVHLNMIGNTSVAIGGTNPASQLNFGKLSINKGNGQALEVNLNSLGNLSAPGNNWLKIENGTFRISRAGSLTLNDQPKSNFFLPATGAIILNNSGFTLNAGMASNDTCDFILAGKLELIAGTMNVGLDANNNHNDIEYAATGTPELIVSGNSVLNVNGQIRRSVSVLLGSLNYAQSGNSTVLVRGKMPVNSFNLNRAKFEILNPGSQFSMSDNALLIIDRNGLASNIFGDIYLAPSSTTITGGEIRVGTSNSSSNTLFEINSNVPLWNLTVDGTTTPKILKVIGNPLNIRSNLKVLGESIFDANALDIQIGGNLRVENSSASPGLSFGGFQVKNVNQTTTFNSALGNQSIQGIGSNMINFANLNLNNTAASGSINVIGGTPLYVSGGLSMISGNFNTAASTVTVLGNVINNVIHTASPGGYISLAGSVNQNISGNGSGQFANLWLNNNAGAQILNATQINGNLNLEKGIFYINNYLLTIGVSGSITASSVFDQNTMIRLNGVASDAGLRKMYPASTGSFTYPIGVTLKYTPVTLSVTTNSDPGQITVRPVNSKHPGTTDPANAELSYYWVTNGSGFSTGASYSHQYNYLQTDANNGDENLYVAGRYFSSQWVPQNGMPGTVSATTNKITLNGVNYINGDFTAGEPQEFGPIQVYYSRSNGNWNDQNSWSVDPVLKHTGAAALVPPTFNPVVIAAAHTITGNVNNLGSPTAEINGTLNLNNTIGHNFGVVSGTGIIRMTPTGTNDFIFPGGSYSAFTAAGGGTIEYYSTLTAALPSRTNYNNIKFTGTGSKSLFNSDILVNGDFILSQGQVTNPYNKQINLKGDFINSSGFTSFNGGSGIVNMSGTNQSFNGATQFSYLVISGGGIKTMNANIQVNNSLQLNNGIITTNGNTVYIPLNGNVNGGSNSSYINGILQKEINNLSGAKLFEIGDGANYTPVNLNMTGTVSGTGSLALSTSPGDHSNIAASGLNASKSANRTWTIQNTGLTISSFSATFNFVASDLDAGVNTGILDIGRKAATWTIPNTGSRTATSTQATGLTSSPATSVDFQIAEQLGGGFTWTGAVSDNWHDSNNWLPTGVPGNNDDITVPNTSNKPNFPTLVNGICRNASFSAGASITIPSGVKLTVAGNWSASNISVNGAGTLEFTSPVATLSGTTSISGTVAVATGANLTTNNGLILNNNASLMHGVGTPGAGGSVSGNVTIKRIGFIEPTKYNYWSAPISNANLNQIGGGSNRYLFNPMAATAASGQGLLAGWQNAAGNMTVTKGYISTGGGAVTFIGTVNNGAMNTGSMTVGAFTSSNLIGNPYPSAISATAFVAANPSIQGGAVYIWDDDNSGGSDYSSSDYITWNGVGTVGPNSGLPFNGNIALGQGFFVNVANSNAIQFNNKMRTNAASTFFESEPIQRFWLNVSTAGKKYNETLIAFKEDATLGEDIAYDALKIKANKAIAFYSVIGEKAYAIQAIPFLSGKTIIPLGIETDVDGIQTMKLGRVDELDETVLIILEDTKLKTFQNLRVNPEYTYDFNRNTDKNRFRIILYPGVELSAKGENCSLKDGSILLKNPSNMPWSVSIQNNEGSLVKSINSFTGEVRIDHLAAGEYLVTLSNHLGSLVHKNLYVNAESPIQLQIQAENSVSGINSSLAFLAHVNGSYTHITWDMGDGTIVKDQTQFSHQYSLPGIYTVKATITNGICSENQELTIRIEEYLTGLSELNNSLISIYPNPVTDNLLNIKYSELLKGIDSEVSLYDLSGKLVQRTRLSAEATQGNSIIYLNGLAPGVYQLNIQLERYIYTGKVTKSN